MEMKDFSLEGKVALVTGASYGIGFAIAEGMAKAGATIVFNDIRQELVDKGLEVGLVLNHIGDSILRFLPPLVISEEQVDEVAGKLAALLA